MVLDLSHFNKFITVPKCKFEDLGKILHVLPFRGYMATFDLKSGYHHVKVCDDHLQYLGFKWQGEIYQFLCLPFGLSSAPHIFTKLLRPFVKKWRSLGLDAAIYLDDGLIFGPSSSSCSHAVDAVRADLTKAGFFFAEEKCSWTPAQKSSWLGFIIDLNEMTIELSEDRLVRARDKLRVFSHVRPSLHDRLSWSGTLAFMHLILSDVDKRNTMAVAREAQAQNWGLGRKWPKSTHECREIRYWLSRLRAPPSRSLTPSRVDLDFDKILQVDASAHSVGAILADAHGLQLGKSYRELPMHLLAQSSTARELFAMGYGLDTFHSQVQSRVLIYTDSQAAAIISKKVFLAPTQLESTHSISHRLGRKVSYAPRFSEGAALTAMANRLGLRTIGSVSDLQRVADG
ncbi:unnamed protein product [Cylicocyclus nassatus]|uniref:Reverse transcriptase domain-containing protein n=1 Tax=Cylicocyclus nassatus TaxID=53992 RepID=A0AA36H0Y1_CYLNA|nr:unnamed protein product [Cylicocyclus nassatus]